MGIDPTAIVDVDTYTASVPKPQVGTPVLAEDVTAMGQALANRTTYLSSHKANIVNPTLFGPVISQGAEFMAPGTILLDSGVSLAGAAGSTINNSHAMVVEPLPYRPADAAIIYIDATVPVRQVMLPYPGIIPNVSVRQVILKSTGTAHPLGGGFIVRLAMPVAAAEGHYFTVKRQDGLVIADLYGYDITTQNYGMLSGSTSVDVYFDGTQWRGLSASGLVVAGPLW